MTSEPDIPAREDALVNPDIPWATTRRILLGTVKLPTSHGTKRIQGVDGFTVSHLKQEVEQGAKFVIYPYAISLLVITLRRASPIMFVPAGHNRVLKGLPYLLISLLLGWWGIPWGLIYTPTSIAAVVKGGHDVTPGITQALISNSQSSGSTPSDPSATL